MALSYGPGGFGRRVGPQRGQVGGRRVERASGVCFPTVSCNLIFSLLHLSQGVWEGVEFRLGLLEQVQQERGHATRCGRVRVDAHAYPRVYLSR